MPHVTIKRLVASSSLKSQTWTTRLAAINKQTKKQTGLEKKKVKSLYSCVTLYFQGDMQDCRSAVSVVSAHKLCR